MENYFARLPKDVIAYMALTMDLPEILHLCLTSKRFNDTVCISKTFWLNKLIKDYNINPRILKIPDPKEYYKLLNRVFNKQKSESKSYLPIASWLGYFGIVYGLLVNGADVHVNDEQSITLAAGQNHQMVVKWLLDYGAKINGQGNNIPLRVAAGNGHLDMVKYLVENGADVNAGIHHTALSVAVEKGYIDMAKYLIENGATRFDIIHDLTKVSHEPDFVEYLRGRGVQ